MCVGRKYVNWEKKSSCAYGVPHEEKQKSFFYILVHISGTKCPMIMLQVPLWSFILTEHTGSYGFASRDVGVSQHGGVSHPLEWQF